MDQTGCSVSGEADDFRTVTPKCERTCNTNLVKHTKCFNDSLRFTAKTDSTVLCATTKKKVNVALRDKSIHMVPTFGANFIYIIESGVFVVMGFQSLVFGVGKRKFVL